MKKLPLRIGQVAPLWIQIPPHTYGGVELLVDLLIKGLLKFDNVIPFGEKLGIPVVHTLHNNLSNDDIWVINKYDKAHIVGISHSQVSKISAQRRKNVHVIYHGIDFSKYTFSEKRGKYLVFLGRMSKEKNPIGAIKIAQQLDIPIILAGPILNQYESKYFNEEILPLIDNDKVKYIGAVNHKQKINLLKNAIALLFPILWEEPFGLVMIEAMACGTPVLALNSGSVPEVIDSGITGYYADTITDLVLCVSKIKNLDRKLVREYSQKRFNHLRMTQEYLMLYEKLIRKNQ